MDDALDGVTDGVLIVDGDWRVTTANAAVERLLDRESAAVVGTDVRDVFPRSVAATFHEHFGGEDPEPAEIAFEEYFPKLEAWLDVRTAVSGEEFTVYLRDVTPRKDLERELEEREAELERLEHINGIIQEIIRDLVGATTRDEVERMVCERLAATDLYEFTWIGEREMTGERVTRRTAAGEYDGVIGLVVEQDADEVRRPEETAIRTGETRVVRHLVDDETVPEPLRREAFARGLQSSITVPLRYGNTTYGVLSVYAARPDAFSEREQESLETLGVATGFVINATRQRNLLLSDTVIELSFRVTDSDAFFVAASAQLDCDLVVEGIVPLDDESLLCYVRVDGAAPGGLLELAEDWADVDASRVVSEEADGAGGSVEITVSGSSPALVLAERAATIRTAEFDRGTGVIVGEIAPSGDVREVVEAVGEAFPRSELLSKQEHERQVETAQKFRSTLHEHLTDRQRNALQTAYHGGYFESPRDSTAEELAETLGISSPTLHYHLRAGQWKLLDAFFDENREYERTTGSDGQRTRENR